MIVQYNLQFFAQEGMGGERTEPATDKKITDARKKGQVAKSKELGNGFALITMFLVLKNFIGYIGSGLLETFSIIYSKIPQMVILEGGTLNIELFGSIVKMGVERLLLIVLPIFLIVALVAFVVEIVQVKWQLTSEPLKPKFSKLDPIKGMKKIISLNSLVELVKSILKIVLLVYVAYSTLVNEMDTLFIMWNMPIYSAITIMGEITFNLGLKIACAYMIIAWGDYVYQKWKFSKDMRMSKAEIKEERKNAEGDPMIKSKQRRKMLEVSMRRMMSDLPKADVVITNPTHFAVALKYDPEIAMAPIVIAKGEDHLALRIKEIAKEHKIEIIEDKPLARMLYANVEVGEQIPEELFQAVAEILSVIYKMQGRA